MGSDSKKPRPAMVEDCDSDGQVVPETKRSARNKDKPKEDRQSRPHRSDSSKENSPRSSQVTTADSEKSSSPTKSRRVEAVRESDKKSRRRSMSGAPSTAPQNPRRSSSRPPPQSLPQLEIPIRGKQPVDPSYYGITPSVTCTPSTSRPSSSRPSSFYGGMPPPVTVSRPPLSQSAFYYPPASAVGTTPSPMITRPSPAESHVSYTSYTAPAESSYFPLQPSPSRPSHLVERFHRGYEPIIRTASAQDVRVKDLPSVRRESIRRHSREAEDLRREMAGQMGPPPPGPLRRNSVSRHSVVYQRSFDPSVFDEELYDPPVRYTTVPPPRRPSYPRNATSDFDLDGGSNLHYEPSGRRKSIIYTDQSTPSSTYEEKLAEATGYQDRVGGPSVPLTRESLRRQERTTASSRSTRSSSSRDESDFKRSATTRTTTSRMEPEDEVRIKIKGNATIQIGSAKINCSEGSGEVDLKLERQKNLRNGSERSISDYSRSEYGKVAPYDYSRSAVGSHVSSRSPRPAHLPLEYDYRSRH